MSLLAYVWMNAQAGSVMADVFNTNVAPSAPTGLTRTDYDATADANYTWTFNDPGDTQGSYQLIIYRASDSVQVYDSTKTASATAAHTVAAGTLTNGVGYEWKVRTWDSYDEVSPYSGLASFTCEAGTPVLVQQQVPLGYVRYGKKYKARMRFWDSANYYGQWSSYGWLETILQSPVSATDIAAKDHLIAITPTGRVVTLDEGTTDYGSAISSRAVYVVPSQQTGDMATDKVLTAIRVVVDLPATSTLSIYHSKRLKDLGDGSDYETTAFSVTGATTPQVVRVEVPGQDVRSAFHRLKFVGSGPWSLLAIDPEYTQQEVR